MQSGIFLDNTGEVRIFAVTGYITSICFYIIAKVIYSHAGLCYAQHLIIQNILFLDVSGEDCKWDGPKYNMHA